jgi:hypothetical protein
MWTSSGTSIPNLQESTGAEQLQLIEVCEVFGLPPAAIRQRSADLRVLGDRLQRRLKFLACRGPLGPVDERGGLQKM